MTSALARTGPPLVPAVPVEQRRGNGDMAAEYIRGLIMSGQLRADQRVPQDEIAERLNISRIPIREGLVALERDGLVRIELNRGAFVNAIDADAVRDHYELYGLTYAVATRRAVARRDAQLLPRLEALSEPLRTSDDPDAFRTLVLAFHEAIISTARSPRVAAALRLAPRMVAGNFFAQVPGSIDVERKGMQVILKALRHGDAERAADAYIDMMRGQGELVVDVLSQRGLFDGFAR